MDNLRLAKELVSIANILATTEEDVAYMRKRYEESKIEAEKRTKEVLEAEEKFKEDRLYGGVKNYERLIFIAIQANEEAAKYAVNDYVQDHEAKKNFLEQVKIFKEKKAELDVPAQKVRSKPQYSVMPDSMGRYKRMKRI